MLDRIIEILTTPESRIEDSIILCEHKIDDIQLIDDITDLDLIENIITDKLQVGEIISLEFSLVKLKSLGFFSNKDFFIKEYLYTLPERGIYIYESKKYLVELPFYSSFETIVNLSQELSSNSKHKYNEEEILNLIIFREEKSLFIKLIYTYEDVEIVSDSINSKIKLFIEILRDQNLTDKKNIFLNELVEFLAGKDEEVKFSYLIRHFELYFDRSIATYNYYLRNFSYNKLKIELDSKALEFSQKIQTVINDSQTKLIAIPTAFVLVLSNLDYEKGDSYKNIVALIGLIIFSILLQLFINNQKSIIRFIDENINRYKSTYKDQNKMDVEQSFKSVDSEKTKQIKRLVIIEFLLWIVPILTLCVIFFLLSYKRLSLLIILMYLVFSFIKIHSNKKGIPSRITNILKI